MKRSLKETREHRALQRQRLVQESAPLFKEIADEIHAKLQEAETCYILKSMPSELPPETDWKSLVLQHLPPDFANDNTETLSVSQAHYSYGNQGSLWRFEWGPTVSPTVPPRYTTDPRYTNPIEDFLTQGTFVKVVQGGKMSMDLFKDLYLKYNNKYGLSNLRWYSDPYLHRTPFRERGLEVTHCSFIDIEGEGELENVDVICNLAPA